MLLVESVCGTSKDGRIIIDDIALARNYTAVGEATNEVMTVDLGVTRRLRPSG